MSTHCTHLIVHSVYLHTIQDVRTSYKLVMSQCHDYTLCMQIGDFGLARDLEDEQYYVSHGGQVPVKWTAPEVYTYEDMHPMLTVRYSFATHKLVGPLEAFGSSNDYIYTFQALYYKKYSTASDVWSFGAVMYEIWSLGHKPFEGYKNPEV